MKKYAKIICDDLKFSRMLTLELNNINVECITDIAENKDKECKLYVIADLDSLSIRDIEEYFGYATVIGFTCGYQSEDDPWYEVCNMILHRPFLISDFLLLFDKEEIIPIKERKTKVAVHTKKYQYLLIDPLSKAALWGDIKIPLSDNEYKVLSVLCENRGTLVERERIYSILGASDGNMGDVYICHLRRKIDNKLGLKLIYTIRGKGYMLKN